MKKHKFFTLSTTFSIQILRYLISYSLFFKNIIFLNYQEIGQKTIYSKRERKEWEMI